MSPQSCCSVLAPCTPSYLWYHGGSQERESGTGTCLFLQSVGSVYSGLMQGVGAAEKVFEFIDRQPTMVHDGDLAPDHLEGRVDFENVTFTYRTRPHTQVLQVRGRLEEPVTPPCCRSLGSGWARRVLDRRTPDNKCWEGKRSGCGGGGGGDGVGLVGWPRRLLGAGGIVSGT